LKLLEALLLGVLQGLTEFLPVSSSGHLVLGQALFGIDFPGVTFEVTVHLATLISVVWVYRRRVLRLATGAVRGDSEAWRYIGLLALASVPAALVGLLARGVFESAYGEPLIAAGMLLITGLLVYSLRFTGREASDAVPSLAQSAWIGLAQAAAILPGISRSGATLAAGAWRGVEVVALAEFSFLMSVPAIAGAGILQLGEAGPAGPGPVFLAVAFAGALVTGVFAIHWFVRVLRARAFHRFAWYCWAAGGAYLVAAATSPGLR
jgi:undecaprenyl-diphosphatase